VPARNTIAQFRGLSNTFKRQMSDTNGSFTYNLTFEEQQNSLTEKSTRTSSISDPNSINQTLG
jgi:hypothetical protein